MTDPAARQLQAVRQWKLRVVLIVGVATWLHLAAPVGAQSPTPTAASGVVSVELGSASGQRGDRLTITATLRTGGLAVAAVQNDISFLPTVTVLEGCAVNPDLGKNLSGFGYNTGGVRAIVVGDNVDPIADGALLYTCTFTLGPATLPGEWPLTVAHVYASSPSGELLPAVGRSGVVVVPSILRTRTPTPTATPVVPAIILDSVEAAAGQQILVSARLQTGGAAVAGTENDLLFDGTSIRVASTATGAPDCRVNPDIDKGATAFAFQPPGCSGTACVGVRGVVLSFANVDPIPDGVTLYTCTVLVAVDAAQFVEHPLGIDAVGLSDSDGNLVPDSIGVKGGIFVVPPVATPTPVRPSIVINPLRGEPGQDVFIAAHLATAGATVAGTQNDIVFDSNNTPIAAFGDGTPDCAVNPDIDKTAASFAFQPPGCRGNACTSMRATIFSADNVTPIADSAVLYTCTVSIAATAPTGVYPLTIDGVVLSTPDGQPVPDAMVTSSAIVFLVAVGHDPHDPFGPGGPPVWVATVTPSGAFTATPTVAPQRTATASPRAATASDGGATAMSTNSGGGCDISAARGDRTAAVWLLLPVAFAALRARRRYRPAVCAARARRAAASWPSSAARAAPPGGANCNAAL